MTTTEPTRTANQNEYINEYMYAGGYLGGDKPEEPDYNPYSCTAYLLTVNAEEEEGWITDANKLLCELVHWERGNFGDPPDPDCKTQTLIGKPLNVLIPPEFRRAHPFFRKAFQLRPTPRTMGVGRSTPIWIKDDGIEVNGMDSITGRPSRVLIGLSAMDDRYTLAIIQPMEVGNQALILPQVPKFPDS